MRNNSSKKSYHVWLNNHIISPRSTQWIAESLEEMDRLVKEMFKLIEKEDCSEQKLEMCSERRSELADCIEDFYHMYRVLAQHYNGIIKEPHGSVSIKSPSEDSDSHSSFSSESEQTSPQEKELKSKMGPGTASFLNSNEGLDASRKVSHISLLSLGTDFDSDTAKQGDFQYEKDSYPAKQGDFQYEKDSSNNCKHNEIEEIGFQLRVFQLEEELLDAKEEILRLNRNFESTSQDLSLKILALNQDLAFANEKLSSSNGKILKLEKEIGEQLKEQTLLKNQIQTLGAHNEELCQKIEDLTYDISTKDSTIAMFESELEASHGKHLQAKNQLDDLMHSVEALSHENLTLNGAITKKEGRIKELQDSLSSSTRMFFEAESNFKMELSSLQEQLISSKGQVDVLNKQMDGLKLQNNMLACRKDVQISNMEGKVWRLQLERGRLVDEGEELRGSVRELQETVKRLELSLLENHEEKREAIRHLCSSLDYYRVRSMELRQALLHYKRPQRYLLSYLISCCGN